MVRPFDQSQGRPFGLTKRCAASEQQLAHPAVEQGPYHLGDRFDAQVESLVDLSGRLAREAADAADRTVLVAGSLPPLFGSYEPDNFDADAAPALLQRIVDALAPHVDVLLMETMSSLAEIEVTAEAARRHEVPLWIAATLSDGTRGGTSVLRSGESVADAALLTVEVGADALLFNCSEPEVMEAAIVEARAALPPDVSVGAYANAFVEKPEEYDANGVVLDHRADLDGGGYTEFVERWLGAGASIVGGCCGIMPAHIALLDELRRP